MILRSPIFSFFFFNDTATTEIYTLSLHDALPISQRLALRMIERPADRLVIRIDGQIIRGEQLHAVSFRIANVKKDRKSTRLNSSHLVISYAVFCLKKKKTNITNSMSNHIIRSPPR